jgi:Tfp pilus assembly protein PilN
VTRVNLLPPELRERAKTRRQTIVVAAVGSALVVLIVFLYVLQGLTENRLNKDLAAQNATNQQLQQQVNELQHFATLRSQLQQEEQLLTAALANTVSWSGVLHDISLVVPDRLWLTNLTGSLLGTTGTAAPVTPTTPGSTIVGNIQFQGASLDSATLALWLTRLEQVKGWVNPWISQAAKSVIGTSTVFQFTSSVDLTAKATMPGGQL